MKNFDELLKIMKRANNNDSLEIAEKCLSDAKAIIGDGLDELQLIPLLKKGRDQIISINSSNEKISATKFEIQHQKESIEEINKILSTHQLMFFLDKTLDENTSYSKNEILSLIQNKLEASTKTEQH
jgi:hypothetical protein